MADESDGNFTHIYHGFSVTGNREVPRGDYQRWYFHVMQVNKLVFTYRTKISGTQAVILGGDVKADELLREIGTSRVHGKIDLNHFGEGENEEYVVTSDPQETSSLTDREIRLFILQVLERIRRLDPIRYVLESFDTKGFCEVLGIPHSHYVANAAYLRESGYVADSRLEQKTLENGGIYITVTGIDYLEEEQQRRDREDAVSKDAEKTRDQILAILYEHEETGDPHYLGSSTIAEKMGLSDKMVRYHLDVLHRDSYIRLSKTSTGWSTILDTNGRQRVIEGYQHPSATPTASGTFYNITNSTIGLLNTGKFKEVDSISVNISALVQSGQTEIAEALRILTEAVAESQDLESEQRSFLLENLEELSSQATVEPEQRVKPGVIKSLVNSVTTTIATTGALAEIWGTWGPTIAAYFGIAI